MSISALQSLTLHDFCCCRFRTVYFINRPHTSTAAGWQSDTKLYTTKKLPKTSGILGYDSTRHWVWPHIFEWSSGHWSGRYVHHSLIHFYSRRKSFSNALRYRGCQTANPDPWASSQFYPWRDFIVTFMIYGAVPMNHVGSCTCTSRTAIYQWLAVVFSLMRKLHIYCT